MKKYWIIPLVAMCIIGLLELTALIKGMNGAMLSSSIGLIAAIGTAGAMNIKRRSK